MEKKFTKWVAMWGNAISIMENRPESYAKNITLQYKIHCPFDGSKLRITFDNYCGNEPVKITKAAVHLIEEGDAQEKSSGAAAATSASASTSNIFYLTWSGNPGTIIEAGKNSVSDEVEIPVRRGQSIKINFYLGDFTQMRSGVYYQGPLSECWYAVGDHTDSADFDINLSKKINSAYFLSNVSILTEEQNRAVVCYGDSITAQDWPEYLQLALENAGIHNTAIIRRAASGTRILREYHCINYESYGLMGKKRFNHEVPTDGADAVIIQQGINDIIHPVGTEVNPFRPMSDLPTAAQLCEGLDWYIEQAQALGYKIYLGNLTPIYGWRTYAPFREELRQAFNEHMRNLANGCGGNLQSSQTTGEGDVKLQNILPTGEGISSRATSITLIDFAGVLADPKNPTAFLPENDSGDHLHPGKEGYKKMADCALKALFPKKA